MANGTDHGLRQTTHGSLLEKEGAISNRIDPV
jgi:hypothetical protein